MLFSPKPERRQAIKKRDDLANLVHRKMWELELGGEKASPLLWRHPKILFACVFYFDKIRFTQFQIEMRWDNLIFKRKVAYHSCSPTIWTIPAAMEEIKKAQRQRRRKREIKASNERESASSATIYTYDFTNETRIGPSWAGWISI